ncbi:DUF2634 domain-containing protein [Culicoidibacter larvae]|uniref:DUF2634 domain-containing protein n=1 Tax=Culicoidibacter larvae TaxID=2579976 RepID=A0A5R8Q7E1_9FIRM|nr:DUF2634 domain-containing protein [Culicoidibacter larvae]TLG71367.1 DUF2634 domain-containing protein [Culicoidibacter larvae]
MLPEMQLSQEKRDFGNITYAIVNGRLVEKISDKDALLQTIEKILSTERYKFLAYDHNFGVELSGLENVDRDIYKEIIKTRISDALKADDRVESIDNFEISFAKDSVTVIFQVTSVFGQFVKEMIYSEI